VSFSEISFLHEVSDTAIFGAEDIPFGLILRDIDSDSAVVFIREYDCVVFHGFFVDSQQAYDYACDRFIMEFYQTEFEDLAGEVTPCDFTASQQESAPVPANAPVEGQPQAETVNCPRCDHHSATATQIDDVRNITCSNCGLDKDIVVKAYPKLSDGGVSEIRFELSTKTVDKQ
jgi:hypothetical protein